MDDFQRALKDNPSDCIRCDNYRWCPKKKWVGEPNCPYPDNRPKSNKLLQVNYS